MADVKVSVIVTTYNHERFVAQAVESVLAQRATFPYEVLLADDFSTDGTLGILRRYECERPEAVRLIVSPENRGDLGMWFFGDVLNLCRGELVAWLDGDDFWTAPEKLQVQADFLDKHPDFSMCFHDVVKVDEKGSLESGQIDRSGVVPEPTMNDLLRANMISSCSPMLRMAVLANLPEWYFEMPFGDWPLYLIAAQQGRVAHLSRVMAAYRVHSGGSWSGIDLDSQRRREMEFYRRLESALDPCFKSRIDEGAYRVCRTAAGACRERGDWTETFRWTLEALMRKPFRTVGAALVFLQKTMQEHRSGQRNSCSPSARRIDISLL